MRKGWGSSNIDMINYLERERSSLRDLKSWLISSEHMKSLLISLKLALSRRMETFFRFKFFYLFRNENFIEFLIDLRMLAEPSSSISLTVLFINSILMFFILLL